MKPLLTLLLVALGLCALPASAQAPWPTRPVHIVVGFPAGGPLDQHARTWGPLLEKLIGQPVVVEYKPGVGGAIGAEFVARSTPDGHTLLLANTGTMVINPAVYPRLRYDTLRDFTPVARTAQQPLALVVHPSVPAKSLREFVALAKSHPGALNYASAGNGGISHLVPEMFKQAAGIYMVHLPYRGSAPAFTDLIGGQVQFMAESVPQAAQYHRQGKVRALAVTGRTRSAALPDTPTVIEQGFPGFEVVGFYGVLAPAGTPKHVIAALSSAFQQVFENQELRARMISQGADPAYLSSADFGRFLQTEMPRWAKVVKASGATVD